jgi:hypothetical protein
MEAFINDFTMAFSALSTAAKAIYLARVAHMETIHVRAAYLDNPNDAAALYRSSEFVHRLCGCIMHVLSHETDASYARSLAALIAEGTGQRGERTLAKMLDWLGPQRMTPDGGAKDDGGVTNG